MTYEQCRELYSITDQRLTRRVATLEARIEAGEARATTASLRRDRLELRMLEQEQNRRRFVAFCN